MAARGGRWRARRAVAVQAAAARQAAAAPAAAAAQQAAADTDGGGGTAGSGGPAAAADGRRRRRRRRRRAVRRRRRCRTSTRDPRPGYGMPFRAATGPFVDVDNLPLTSRSPTTRGNRKLSAPTGVHGRSLDLNGLHCIAEIVRAALPPRPTPAQTVLSTGSSRWSAHDRAGFPLPAERPMYPPASVRRCDERRRPASRWLSNTLKTKRNRRRVLVMSVTSTGTPNREAHDRISTSLR